MGRRYRGKVARLAAAVLSLLTAVPMVLGGVAAASTPAPPWKDANNGSPSDHGWFEGGKAWYGDFGDPDVIRVGNVYYAYSSPTGGRYMPVLTSTDLQTWYIHAHWSTSGPPGSPGYSVSTDPSIPVEIRASVDTDWNKFNNNDALVKPASWALPDLQGPWLSRDYWAPSVIQIGSTWYAYAAVKVSNTSDDPHGYGRFCLTVASATSPAGPFRDVSGSGPIQCQSVSSDPAGSIDPFPYYNATNGKYYLLWKAAGKIGVRESRLLATELGTNGKPKTGAPVVTLLQTNRAAPWEGGTVEAPAMIQYAGRTYLFYAANFSGVTDSLGHSNYATGYAICPQGPLAACTRPEPGQPLLFSNGIDQGPGGATPFLDTNGGLHLAYSSFWLGENRDGVHPRRMHITGLSALPDGRLWAGVNGSPPKVQPTGWGRGAGTVSRRPTSWGSPGR